MEGVDIDSPYRSAWRVGFDEIERLYLESLVNTGDLTITNFNTWISDFSLHWQALQDHIDRSRYYL
jgi:hypothetical protein